MNVYRKGIAYDRETREYAMYLDEELVGFARTYHEADLTLDHLVSELLRPMRACASCGDPSLAPLCPACVEWENPPIPEELEFYKNSVYIIR